MLSLQGEHDVTALANYCFVIGMSLESLKMDEKSAYDLLELSKEMTSSSRAHRTLAAFLPFIGLLCAWFCQSRTRDIFKAPRFVDAMMLWSESVYAYSCASEREILRISALSAARASAGGLLSVYELLRDDREYCCESIVGIFSRYKTYSLLYIHIYIYNFIMSICEQKILIGL